MAFLNTPRESPQGPCTACNGMTGRFPPLIDGSAIFQRLVGAPATMKPCDDGMMRIPIAC